MEKKEITLGQLAKELGGELVGEAGKIVHSIKDINEAKDGDLAFIFRKRAESTLSNTKASCVVTPEAVKTAPIPIIRCKNPNLSFKKAISILVPEENKTSFKGIDEKASIAKDASIGKEVFVGACAVIESGASIGEGTKIYPHAYIGKSVKVGKNCIIYPNVTILDKVTIGERVIIHSGSIIGADGFGYEITQRGYEKIPQIGSVIIEDDVELGASVAVDRAKISNTKIGRGTKIDNLVQIAHNVTIGSNCIIVAQTGISGSVKIGNNVVMGGQVGIADHLEIGDNSMIAAQAGVIKSVPPNTIMWGKPARPIKKAKEIYALFDKLPDIYKRLKMIEEKLGIKK